jgi:short-subunit dehydrogenase
VLEHAADVREEFGRVDLAFCVAGVIHTGTLADSDLADFEHVMNVNLWGTVNTVKALLPMIAASGEGHIVTVSSAFGLMAAPRYSAYATSKFAVRGFTEALRQEMAVGGQSVRVSCAFPGGVRTQIIRTGRFAAGEDAAATADRFDRRIARTTPERAASTILRGVQRGRAQILVGADAHLVWLLLRVVGASYQRILPWILRGRDAPDQNRQDERQADRQMRSRWRSWPNGGS